LGNLRDYQEPVIKKFQNKIKKGYRDLILEADTGAGKTIMLIYMMHLLGRSTLVIVPKTDLVSQWRKRILEFTDIPASRIGLAQQDVCEFEGKSVVIGMIHSVCKDRYPEEFKRHFGVVLFDELHKLGAFYFSKVGGMFPAKYRIGATATLSRSDGLERAFLVHLGDEIIRPPVSEQPVPEVAVYTYKQNSGRLPSYLQETISRRGVLLSRLGNNHKRSAVIAKFAAQLVDSGRQTLVVSERIPHLEKIHEYMIQMGVPESDLGFYLGKTSKKERARVARECSCILATMSMLSLGTDIPTLRGLVFATPVSQIAQPVGRIRRINPELKDPFVVDFYDSDYDECTRWMRNRRRFYESIGCRVHYIDN
jgi:superfamily II DNA or RNA helicase